MSLTIFDIESRLDELMDAWSTATPEQLPEIEQAIAAYAEAEVRKVDGLRAAVRHYDTQAKAADEESKIQAERSRVAGAKRDRLKAFIFGVMNAFGVPKLEGRTGRFRIQGNGGKQPIEVTDASLVPDELKTITVTMPISIWKQVLDEIDINDCTGVRQSEWTPSLSLIAEALQKPCDKCGGEGGGDIHGPNSQKVLCGSCGGSGKAGVPGARLGERGSHLRVE